MTQISVRLVRRAHGNLTVEQLEGLEIIQLQRQNIVEIDNLEVFSEIKELHLGGNKIRVIENLSFLHKLEFLDLSYNRIDEAGLRACLGQLPKSLLTLVLTGNPCCSNLDVLGELNDLIPNLGIVLALDDNDEEEGVTGVYEEKGGDKGDGEYENDDDEDKDEGEDEGGELAGRSGPDSYEDLLLKEGEVLDSEEVLKAIVGRKCSQQELTFSSFNMEATLAELNNECESAIQVVKLRKQKKKKEKKEIIKESGQLSEMDEVLRRGEDSVEDMEPSRLPSIFDGSDTVFFGSELSQVSAQKAAVDNYLQNSRQRVTQTKDFFASMRENILKKRDEKMKLAKETPAVRPVPPKE